MSEIKKEDLEKMTAEELAGHYNKINSEKTEELEKSIEAKASKEEIEALKDELKVQREQQMKNLNAILEKQGVMIKRLSKEEKDFSAKSIKDQIKLSLGENKENLTTLGSGDKKGSKEGEFNFKVATTMTISGSVSGGNVPVEQREAGMLGIAKRQPYVLDLVSRGTAVSNVISWVEQSNEQGGAGGTAEGDAKNQYSFDLVVTSETVKKRTVYIKVSTEMLDDIDFMSAEINNELIRTLLLDVDDQLLNGDNVGQNLNGLINMATAFAGGTFAGTVDNANIVDVLVVALNQIAIANQSASHIIMHPSDVTSLKLTKVSATDRRYVERLAMVGGELSLDGIPIIANTGIAQDTYLVGDMNRATVFDKGAIGIEVGLDSDDFTKNLRTVIAEWRGLQRIKVNDRTAFVTGTFSVDTAVLETP